MTCAPLRASQCSPFVTNHLLDHGLTETWAGLFYGLNVLTALCGTLVSPFLIKIRWRDAPRAQLVVRGARRQW